MTRTTLAALAISLAWGLLVAVAGYAVVRTIQAYLYPAPNPATLVWSAHSGFFWRCWTVGYAGGIGAFIAFAVVRTRASAAARALVPAVTVAAVMLTVQALVFP